MRYDTESISFLAPKIWEILPNEIKNLDALQVFKEKIKMWVPVECTSRLCKIYLPPVGFMEMKTTVYILQSMKLLNFVVTLCFMY